MPALLTIAVFAFVLYCIFDVVLTDATDVRNLPKPAWLVVVIFLPVIGSVAWLIGGRPERSGHEPSEGGEGGSPQVGSPPPGMPPAEGRSAPTGSPARSRPRGPDDDPEFLRRVDERLRRRNGRPREDD